MEEENSASKEADVTKASQVAASFERVTIRISETSTTGERDDTASRASDADGGVQSRLGRAYHLPLEKIDDLTDGGGVAGRPHSLRDTPVQTRRGYLADLIDSPALPRRGAASQDHGVPLALDELSMMPHGPTVAEIVDGLESPHLLDGEVHDLNSTVVDPATLGQSVNADASQASPSQASVGTRSGTSSRRRVCILYTGGTIGMVKTETGYAPAPESLMDTLRKMVEFSSIELPITVLHQYSPLIDSSNMTPTFWIRIAKDIMSRYDEYDGFIVLHGTDTMAYTASALSFMLENLTKPVIVTGSQLPIFQLRNDGRHNLIVSMILAASSEIPEVCIFFDDKLMRGNRCVKQNCWTMDAFHSPNYPPLGEVGIDIHVNVRNVLPLPNPSQLPRAFTSLNTNVVVCRVIPGMSVEVMRRMLEPPTAAMVLEVYGTGNAPCFAPGFLDALTEATARDVVIVAVSQCLTGSVVLDRYEAGSVLGSKGVISGNDLTTEAAVTKMMYLLGMNLPPSEVQRLMQEPLVGELTKSSLDHVVGEEGALWLFDNVAEISEMMQGMVNQAQYSQVLVHGEIMSLTIGEPSQGDQDLGGDADTAATADAPGKSKPADPVRIPPSRPTG